MTIVAGGFLWWWLIYNSYHNMHLVIGNTKDFPFMAGKQHLWSDKELGIPPDEAGLAPEIENPRTTRIPGCIKNHMHFEPYYLKMKFGDEGRFKF